MLVDFVYANKTKPHSFQFLFLSLCKLLFPPLISGNFTIHKNIPKLTNCKLLSGGKY